MSALGVAGVAAATVAAFLGVGAVALATSKWEFLDTGSPEQLKRERNETLLAIGIFGGVIVAGTAVAVLTPFKTLGTGVAVGAGSIASLIALDKAFPQSRLTGGSGQT